MQDDDKPHGNTGLPREIQEHLGRRLRTELHIDTDKPAFLGEPAVPPQFETLVRKLEAGENGERQGYEAVKRALIGDSPEPAPAEPAPPPAEGPVLPRIPRRAD